MVIVVLPGRTLLHTTHDDRGAGGRVALLHPGTAHGEFQHDDDGELRGGTGI